MAAIPTRYSGVQFRSRLEARWAAFFDLLGWKWEYEPIDLAGYIPDFIVEHGAAVADWSESGGPDGWLVSPSAKMTAPVTRRLIEVKPSMDAEDLMLHTAKIDQSGWTGEASIVGAMLWPGPDGGFEIGAIRYARGEGRHGWGSWYMRGVAASLTLWREAGNLVQWRGPYNAEAA